MRRQFIKFIESFEGAEKHLKKIRKASNYSEYKIAVNTKMLENDGYAVISGPRTTGDGYYESCVVGIEGNQIEITV